MRALSVCVLAVFAFPSFAADKDDEKAKEVIGTFFKAILARDTDAVMKTLDTPFELDFGNLKASTFNKPDGLKKHIAYFVKEAEPEIVMAVKIIKIYDMPALVQYGNDKGQPGLAAQAEKLVGKSGRAVELEAKKGEKHLILIRYKDGKAFIASFPQ